MTDYLTTEDRDLLEVACALWGWATAAEALEATIKEVEQIVAKHRTEAIAEALRDAADQWGPNAGAANWLRQLADWHEQATAQ